MKTNSFKPFAATDADIVVAMMEQFYAIDNYPINAETAKNLFLEFIADEKLGRGWSIELDGEPAGYVILTFVFSFEYKGRIAFLDELYISDAARGQGLGKMALDFIEEQAKALAVKIIYLEIENHNTVAQQLYLSKGYKIHNRGLMKIVLP